MRTIAADQWRVDWIRFRYLGSLEQPDAFHDPAVTTSRSASEDACGGVARNTGILPVSSDGHPAWSRMSRLGSLLDLSGWKPKLLRLRRSRARSSVVVSQKLAIEKGEVR
jgi:hypothetical protein